MIIPPSNLKPCSFKNMVHGEHGYFSKKFLKKLTSKNCSFLSNFVCGCKKKLEKGSNLGPLGCKEGF